MSMRIAAAAAGLAMLAGLPATALANSTGNASNNPAVIQGYMPPPPPRFEHNRSSALHERNPARKVCDFNGSESGSRNPDVVTCFN
jgi:hypothetical protein